MSKLRYFIASDHAGFHLKSVILEVLKKRDIEVIDLGPSDDSRVDYPDFAKKLSENVVANSNSFGILICGTGIGMSIAANKVSGIRAAVCQDPYSAKMARAHNDANVLCFGARVVGEGMAEDIIDSWFMTDFEGGRHSIRIGKLENR